MRVGVREEDFNFLELNDRRQEIEEEFSSGVIRSTMDGIMELYVEGGFFSSFEWKPHYAVLTNVGLFLFDPKDYKEPYTVYPLSTIQVLKQNAKTEDRGNIMIVKV